MNDLQSLGDGIFYPGDRNELNDLVKKLLADAPHPERSANSVVTPHGAYGYCGNHMAAAFRALRTGTDNTFKRIIIIAPLHREADDGIFLTETHGITIPTGRMAFDRESTEMLANKPHFSKWEVPFMEEPAMELQLPFIAELFPDIPILPLFASAGKKRIRKALASALTQLSGSGIVISTNLTEYMERKRALAVTEEFIRDVESSNTVKTFDPESWNEERKGGLPRPCGIDLLSSYWMYSRNMFPESSTRMKVLSWGPDTLYEKKAAFYGGFALYSGTHPFCTPTNIG